MALPHRQYHEILQPGISIGNGEGASTLGAFFQTESEPGKKYLLTVKHAVGDTGSPVFQPGPLNNNAGHCAIVSHYNFRGVDGNGNILDYAFCEIENREASLTNKPFHTNIPLTNLRQGITENRHFCVQKVGRTTAHTYGVVRDRMRHMRHPDFHNSGRPVRAMIVDSVFGEFGNLGDSGSPVFDENGCLWGIFQGIVKLGSGVVSGAVIIPIHLILNHVEENFGAVFTLRYLHP